MPGEHGRNLCFGTALGCRLLVRMMLPFLVVLGIPAEAASVSGHLPASAQSLNPLPAVQDSIAVARQWMHERDLQGAEALLKRLLPRAEQAEGDSSVLAAEVLDLLAEAMWQARGPAGGQEAEPLAERAVSLKKVFYGQDHLEVASSLFNLGVIRAMSGRYAESEAVFQTIYEIRASRLPPGHSETLTALNALGNVKKEAGDLTGAAAAYERGLEAAEAGGTQHSDGANMIRGNLGGTLSDLGRFDEARPLLQERVAHYDSTGDASLSGALNDLANFEVRTGNYPRAAELYERALALEEERAGPLTAWAIRIRGNTAANLARLGKYAAAWELLERQAALLDSTGASGRALGLTYERLAHIAAELGDDEREIELRQRALAMLTQSLPPEHPRIATALHNLGTVYGRMGDLDGQEEVLERAQRIWTSRLGPRHEMQADYLLALGDIAQRRGNPAKARDHTEEALRVARDRFGEDSPRTSAALSALGRLSHEAGRLDEARALFSDAVGTMCRSLGADHPLAAEQELRLAHVEQAAGESERASELAFRAEAILTPHLRLTLRNLPERQALLYVGERSGAIDLIVSLLDASQDPALVTRVWDAVIRTRGLVFDELASRVRQRVAAEGGAAGSQDPGAAALAAYQRAATRLANLVVSGPLEENSSIYRTLLAGAREDLENAERNLAEQRWPDPAGQLVGEPAGFEEVAAALPPATALVAYVRYDRYARGEPSDRNDANDPNEHPGAAGTEAPQGRYRAFVLNAGESGAQAVDIGAARGIDGLIEDWRAAVTHPRKRDGVLHAETGRLLRRVLWDPVAPHCAGAQQVLIVPAERIHLVNLAALPDEGGAFLIEAPQVFYQLTCEREVVDLARPWQAARDVLVLGGPDFDWLAHASSRQEPPLQAVASAAADRTPPFPAVSSAASAGLFRGAYAGCDELASLRFGALASSRTEAEQVLDACRRWFERQGEDALTVRLFTGPDANEAAFKQWAPRCRLLHVATHGFLLDPACSRRATDGPAHLATVANPLLYSGLALAGANHRAEAVAGEEDGLLTAQEIAALDLSGVEQAVLSACDSQGREIVPDEGVFGLQRAFRIAGARSVIATLWPVEDMATSAWMAAFYEANLDRGLESAWALREAGLSVLRQRRARGEDTHPFYWGAFIGSGDWK